MYGRKKTARGRLSANISGLSNPVAVVSATTQDSAVGLPTSTGFLEASIHPLRIERASSQTDAAHQFRRHRRLYCDALA